MIILAIEVRSLLLLLVRWHLPSLTVLVLLNDFAAPAPFVLEKHHVAPVMAVVVMRIRDMNLPIIAGN